jgi:hypothetical protein
VELIAEREIDKIAANCARYEARARPSRSGCGSEWKSATPSAQQIEHRIRMLLCAFGAYGVLPLLLLGPS